MSRRWCLSAACLILLSLAPRVQAQKLHALLVGDVSPWAQWGDYLPHVQMDLVRMWWILNSNIPPDQLEIISLHISESEEADPAQVLAALDELHPAANDTVLCYFTGHGGLDDRGSFLSLEKGPLYRDALTQRLADKRARLTVLLTDCCNARSDGRKSVHAVPMPDEPRQVTPIFRTLLFEPQGVVDVSACSPGETAQFFLKVDHEYRGSLFTRSLTDYLERRRHDRVGWETLLRDVSVAVHVAFRENYPDGVRMAKGGGVQDGQTVYAAGFPGMPPSRGPRVGLLVRDLGGQGVLIARVDPDSPSTKVYDLTAKRYTSLKPQQIIRTVNGRAVTGAAEFMEATKNSPQVMRVEAGTARQGWREYLIRLKY